MYYSEFLMIIHTYILYNVYFVLRNYQSLSKLLLPSSYNIIVFTSYSSLAGESGQRDYDSLSYSLNFSHRHCLLLDTHNTDF